MMQRWRICTGEGLLYTWAWRESEYKLMVVLCSDERNVQYIATTGQAPHHECVLHLKEGNEKQYKQAKRLPGIQWCPV